MLFKIPILVWLTLSPIGKADLLGGLNNVYFHQKPHCAKADVSLTIKDNHVEVVYKCKWRSCSYESKTTDDSLYELQVRDKP